MRIETLYSGIDTVKTALVLQLQDFFKKPNLYHAISQQDFSQTQVHTEFPRKSKHLPLVAISEASDTAQFVDIRATNFVIELTDEETGELTAHRYGGAEKMSINVDVATLSVPQRQKLTDLTKLWFQLLARDFLNREGIQVLEVRLSGTSEVPQDQDPNFVYVANIAVDLWVDWYIDVSVEVIRAINTEINNC